MNGQEKNYKFYEKQLNEYIQTHNVYKPSQECNIDLRALNTYITTHDLTNADITPDIVNKFKLD